MISLQGRGRPGSSTCSSSGHACGVTPLSPSASVGFAGTNRGGSNPRAAGLWWLRGAAADGGVARGRVSPCHSCVPTTSCHTAAAARSEPPGPKLPPKTGGAFVPCVLPRPGGMALCPPRLGPAALVPTARADKEALGGPGTAGKGPGQAQGHGRDVAENQGTVARPGMGTASLRMGTGRGWPGMGTRV